MGYFSVDVKPTITASTMVAHTTKDVLFDWTSFQVPKGANKLISVSATFRGINGGVQTARKFDLYFAKSIDGVAPVTMGVDNATITAAPITTNHLLGQTHFETGDWGNNGWDYIGTATTGGGAGTSNKPDLVLQGEPESGDNVGYDTLYVAGAAAGGIDFGTSVLTTGIHDVSGLSAATIASLDDGSDGDALATKKFAVGDIIHATGDVILGEILTIDSDASLTFRHDGLNGTPVDLTAWKIQNGAGAAGDLANNDELFNINPIKLTLSFER